MVERVNGTVKPNQSLTGGLNFFTVRTTLDIRYSATGDLSNEAQKRLNKLVEVISTRAQPVIIGDVAVSTETAPIADLPVTASSTGDVTVYALNFSIEHNLAWEAEALAEVLNGVAGFVYDVPTDQNNVAVVMRTQL